MLLRVLKGLSLQTRHPDEVIVADDGSGPETAQLVFDFSKGATFPVKHLWQEDQGARVCRARNEAVKAATGEYIIFMDGDCVPNRHYVADHSNLSEKGHFVQGKRILLDEAVAREFGPEQANSAWALLKAFLGGHLSNSHHLIRLPMLPAFKNTWLRGTKSCNFGVFKDDVIAVNGFNQDFDGEIGREEVSKGPSRNDELFKRNLQDPSYRCRNGIVKEEG
jgi:glycosyltransferase involved in cell wall biosynthesis